ncbi:hypothetical protein LIA77_04473 [Sarocladium implicatum]|nr:hypothetical protein LIA77_04473 [Sarocladium implicatum]
MTGLAFRVHPGCATLQDGSPEGPRVRPSGNGCARDDMVCPIDPSFRPWPISQQTSFLANPSSAPAHLASGSGQTPRLPCFGQSPVDLQLQMTPARDHHASVGNVDPLATEGFLWKARTLPWHSAWLHGGGLLWRKHQSPTGPGRNRLCSFVVVRTLSKRTV